MKRLEGIKMVSLINRRLLRIIFFVLVLAIFCPFTSGKIIYVDDDVTGANDGTNWTDAYVFLQDALADANDSDKPVEIRVAQGIYKPDQGTNQTPGDRKATFRLINGVTLSGGYAGVDANDPNAHDIELYESILSGDLNGDDEAIDDLQTLYYETTRYDNSYNVVTAEYTDETAELDGVTLTAGMANIDTLSSVNQQHGGGFNCYEAHPIIANCTFKLNVARQGAGIYNYGGEPSIINCKFVNNVALCDPPERGRGSYGSGLYNIYGKPVLTNCEFIENYGDYGAGISIHRSDNVIITNCLFKQNQVSSKGGGMHCEDNNNLAIINCRFIENYNSGRYDSGDGGAIYIITGDYLLTDCIFKNNSAENSGGTISNSDAYVNIKNCLFAGNSAGNAGGAISLEESSIGEICNCTIAHNRATKGGGLYVVGSSTRVKITNSIIWGNSEWMYINRSGLSINYSCVPALFYPRPGAQITNIMAEPLFAEPGYWDPNSTSGDLTDDFWVDGDYHLKSQAGRFDPNCSSWVIDDITSPCIDAGDPNSSIGDEPFPNGGIINMGAYGGRSQASKSYFDESLVVDVNDSDNGREITLEQGQILIVTLESNPTTGYSWEVVESPDLILEQIGKAEYKWSEQRDSPIVGAGGWEVYRFKAVIPGSETLELVYRRPWETDTEPAKTFSIDVIVN
jgi:predicted outer membrane repeat protein